MEIVTREHPWYMMLPVAGILVYLLTLTGYWQLIFAAGLVAGILMKRPWGSFAVAFAGGSLAWGIPLGLASLNYPLTEASCLLLEILGFSSCVALLPYVVAVLISGAVTGLGALLGAHVYGFLRGENTRKAS